MLLEYGEPYIPNNIRAKKALVKLFLIRAYCSQASVSDLSAVFLNFTFRLQFFSLSGHIIRSK